jgi:hypothetical protein
LSAACHEIRGRKLISESLQRVIGLWSSIVFVVVIAAIRTPQPLTPNPDSSCHYDHPVRFSSALHRQKNIRKQAGRIPQRVRLFFCSQEKKEGTREGS